MGANQLESLLHSGWWPSAWELNKQLLSSRLCFWLNPSDQKSNISTGTIYQRKVHHQNIKPHHARKWYLYLLEVHLHFSMIHSSWAWALSFSEGMLGYARMIWRLGANHDDFQVKCQFLARLLFHVVIFRFSRCFKICRVGIPVGGHLSHQPLEKKKRNPLITTKKTPWP